jgi:ATP-dependent Lon protease
MIDNYLAGVEAQADKNAFVLPGLRRRVTFKSDRNFQSKVDTNQQVILMPTEYGIEEYRERDIKIASLCRYEKVEKSEDGVFTVTFGGISLCIVKELKYDDSSSSYYADVELLPEQTVNQLNYEIRKLVETIQTQFKEYLKISPSIEERTIEGVKNPKSIDRLIGDVTLGAKFDNDVQRSLVNERDPLKRLQILSSGLETRIFEQEAEKGQDLVAYYKHQLAGLVVGADIKKRIYLEMSRLKNLKKDTSEYGNVIDWLDRVLAFPWNTETEDSKDLNAAKDILNTSHFGLEKLKQRIFDIIAIQKYTDKQPPQILCLYGPPGVGKSTIAKSIAEALDKDYYAISLGGTNKSEDIAGMKRFFIGAKPGKIVDSVTQAGSKNCVILLDEVDKMGSNQNHSDPTAVLLQVLDRNQNSAFKDDYFDIPMDLSGVFFIATANDLSTIPRPLLDRLEILTLDGYSLNEKVQITNNYLIKKVAAEFGLEQDIVSLFPETISKIIEEYTFESGVRKLENVIREIVRKHIAYKASSGEPLEPVQLSMGDINKMIEDAYKEEPNVAEEGEVGVVNKMSVKNGNIGDVGRLEVVITESGKGEQIVSDNIVGTALSTLKTTAGLLRYRAQDWQISEEIFSGYDIYIHSPIHEVTHDGSSGGVADVICILSAIKNVPVPHTIAITGAITLKGRVMRIGGVKAKVLAAQRHRMKTVILPLGNKKDVDELPPDVTNGMEFKYFEDMTDVYAYIFGDHKLDTTELPNT